MAIFMVSSRIAQIGNDGERRGDLEASMIYETTMHWKETTSFLIIRTDNTIDTLAQWAKGAISESYDLVLIRELGRESARVVGKVEDPDLFTLMPYCKRA